jgi:glycerate-2-kinase
MESTTNESTTDEQKVSKLQEIMEQFSTEIAESIRNLIFTKTREGEEKVTEDIANKEQQIENIINDAKNTNQEIDSKALKEKIQKMILEQETLLREEQTSEGINVEILNEQEKVRSIVNKYIQ